MSDDNQKKSLEDKVDEILQRLSYESLRLWNEKQQKEKNESNPLRSGEDQKTEGIP